MPRAQVGLSSASVYPESTVAAFEIAAKLGYDGIELMVWTDPISQDPDAIRRLSDHYGVPLLAVHSPCLLVTQRVWGTDPWLKLERGRAAAELLGAGTVVIHPPFRWQRDYAREFGEGLRRMAEQTDVRFAVENMFPLWVRGRRFSAYLPTWDVASVAAEVPAVTVSGPAAGGESVDDDYWVSDAGRPTDLPGLPPDPAQLLEYEYFTLDLSHTAVSQSDAERMLADMGEKMVHLHMADGTGQNRDEHLVPGRGEQPCAEILRTLRDLDYAGNVIVEVNTRRAMSREHREAELSDALVFCRRHLGQDQSFEME
jgi:sugar phosphate isomerase/epimerase